MKTIKKDQHEPEKDLAGCKIVNYPAFIVKAEVEETSDSGNILIPKSSNDEEEKEFEIVGISENCTHVKNGDRILLRDRTNPIATISRNGNKYMLFEEISVVMILDREKDASDDNQ